jgi:hypothetical protein
MYFYKNGNEEDYQESTDYKTQSISLADVIIFLLSYVNIINRMSAVIFFVRLTEQIVLLPLFYDSLLISSNDLPRVCSPNNIIRTAAINENNDIATITFKKPYG